ncbi:MAG: DUF3152 domain-containing protein [Nocardioides sp.]
MRRQVMAVVVVLVGTLLPGAGAGGVAEPPVASAPATVEGDTVFRAPLVARRGRWLSSEELRFRYQWLRGGREIAGATDKRYRPGLADLGRRLRVRVTATDPADRSGESTSAPTDRVRRAELVNEVRPTLSGTRRYTRLLTADPGEWSAQRPRFSYRWLRDGRPIRGADRRSYRLGPRDVGHRVRVRVTTTREGYQRGRTSSRATRAIMHRVGARRTATYRIETRGSISADMSVFRAQVAETFADPRGWRSAGVVFKRVARGGDFSVVLAEASTVPSFSPVCSAEWSCRVGRYVVINQMRWKHASPSWNNANEPLRGYRHMVVNHETGHWLGHGHLGCGGNGNLAPVMMQQSKGLDGCRHNPWPLASELWVG